MNKNTYAVYNSRFGRILIGYNEKYITKIVKLDEKDCSDNGIRNKQSDSVFKQIEEYFDGKRTAFDFPYELSGTEFQKKVWKALEEIPYGETSTYKEIAIKIGNKNASRAIGMANHKNPLLIVVPCHRVIGSNGDLVGYAGGLDMKLELLVLEKIKQ